MFANFTEETCTGTGDVLTLAGATNGNLPFSASFNDGDSVACAVRDADGVTKVAGIYTFNAADNTITRADAWSWDGTSVDKQPAANIALSGGVHTITCTESISTLKRSITAVVQETSGVIPSRPAGYDVVHYYCWEDPQIDGAYPYDQWVQISELVNGFDVIVLIGQSNMVGRNGPVDAELDATNPRIFQYKKSTGEIDIASDPLDHWDETANTVGMGLSFAKAYLATLPANRDVLLIPAADGGTGFSTGNWRDGDPQNEYGIAAANAVLALPGSKLIAFLWHQGETDRAFTQAQYEADLDSLISQYRSEITGATNTPFIVGKVPSWSSQYGAGVAAALEATPSRVEYTALVQTDDLTDGGDSLHFNAASQRVLGGRYFDALAVAIANEFTAQVPDAIVLGGVSQDGAVALSWPEPNDGNSPITEYIIEYKESSSSTWSTVSGIGTDTSVIVTGLTNETSYDFRGFAVNAIGTSLSSSVITKTPTDTVSELAETGADAHWLFGDDNTGYEDLISQKALTPNNAATIPVNNSGYMTLPAGTAIGMYSDIADKAEETIVFVVRKNSTSNGGSVFGGAFSQTEGSAIYFQNSQIQSKFNIRGTSSANFGSFAANNWYFLALSLKNITASTDCQIRAFQGDSTDSYFYEATTTSEKIVSSTNKYSIGSVFYDNDQFRAAFDIAEFMVFSDLKTEAELQAIYERSVTRMAARGVTLS